MLDNLFLAVSAVLISYFLCGINFSVIISNRYLKKDIRQLGSGNPGTTNMFRNFGIRWGLLTFILDMAKGVVCSGLGWLISYYITNDIELGKTIAFMCAAGAVLGHIFPIFLNFNGGKGVATSIGAMLVLNTIPTLIILVIFLIVLLISDRMSICALLFVSLELSYILIVFIPLANWYIVASMSIIFLFIVISHRENIVRLINGKENATGVKKYFSKK